MATIYWIGSNSGRLDDPANWDLDRVPGQSDDVIAVADAYYNAPGDDDVPGAVTARTVTVSNDGVIMGGVWNAPVTVTANGSLGAGESPRQPTFNGSVTVGSPSNGNPSIYRGVFNAEVDCYGGIFGGTFHDLVRLLGTRSYVYPLYSVALADRFQVGSGPVLYADTSPRVALPSQVKSGVSNCGSTGSYASMVLARAQLGM